MKILISSPYLDSLGGGERYILTIAEILSKSHQVDIIWGGHPAVISQAEERFNLNLDKVNLISKSIEALNIFQRFFLLRDYDISIFLTDGSIPFLFAKKNFIHVQVPFNLKNQNTILNKLKFRFVSGIICNSRFTKSWAKKTYPNANFIVLYPPVDIAKINPNQKENIIFSVARFANHLNNKRQDILLDAFKKFHKLFPDYRLVLAGASKNIKNKYLEKLKNMSKGLPVEFLVNPPGSTLQKYYGKAKYFWHAAGYGVDEKNNPEQTEHFGIVLVEAMAAECFVCAVDKGGAREIIKPNKNGYLWESINDLVNCHANYKQKIVLQAKTDSYFFSKETFQTNLAKILSISL